MNTKGTRFLAVLAVLAFAFAAFAVLAPASDAADSFDVTYKINIAESEVDDVVVSGVSGEYTIADMPKSFKMTGYALASWNTAADGSGTSYNVGDNVTVVEDLDLYAIWTINYFKVNNKEFADYDEAVSELETSGVDTFYVQVSNDKMTAWNQPDVTVQFVEAGIVQKVATSFTGKVKYSSATAVLTDVTVAETITITSGSIAIDGEFTGGTIDGTRGEVYISGSSTGLVLSGTVRISDDYQTGAFSDTLTVNSGATLILGTDVEIEGTLVNNGTILMNTGAGIPNTVTGTGTVKSAMETLTIEDQNVNGTATDTTEYPMKQRLTVTGGSNIWTIGNGTDETVITINGELIVPSGSKIVIQTNAELIIQSGAIFNLDGAISIEQGEEGGADSGKLTVIFGTVNVSSTATVSGDMEFLGESTQVYGNLNLLDGADFTLRSGGSLDVSENGQVTIAPTASMTLNGQFVIGKIENSGSLVIDSKEEIAGNTTVYMAASGAAVDIKKIIFPTGTDSTEGSYTITITDQGLKLATYKYVDENLKKSTGTVSVGDAAFLDLHDYTGEGTYNTVRVNGEMPVNTITITDTIATYMTDTFTNFKVIENVTSTVQDSEPSDTAGYAYTNSRLYVNSMQIGGSPAAKQSTDVESQTAGAADVEIVLDGDSLIEVVDGTTLEINNNVAIDNTATLKVGGTITSLKASGTNLTASELNNNGEITLVGNGMIQTLVKLNDTVYGALVQKTVSDTMQYWYMTVDNAIDMINSDSTVDTATVVGDSTVTKTNKLNAEEYLVVNSDVTLNIGDEDSDVLTLDKAATLRGSGTVNVVGTLYAEDNTRNKLADSTISDVYSQELNSKGLPEKYGWGKWTNLTAALAEAPAGSIVTVSKEDYVYLASNTVIKDGVTLYVPSDVNGIIINNGVTLTVNGILKNESDIYAQTQFDVTAKNLSDEKTSAIIVNGVFYTDSTSYGYSEPGVDAPYTDYSGIVNVNAGAPIAGAYYTTSDYSCISSLKAAIDNLAEVASAITLYGAITADSVSFTGTDDCDQIIVGAGIYEKDGTDILCDIPTSVSISSLTIDEARFQIGYNSDLDENKSGIFTGTVKNDTGAVTFKHLETDGTSVATVQDSDGELVLKGDFVLADSGDSMSISSGTVYAGAMVVSGAYTTSSGSTSYNAMSIASGATLVADSSSASIDSLTVNGTLSVPGGKVIVVNEKMTINGSVAVAEATSSVTSGTLTNSGDVYVGISSSELGTHTSASATVSGPIGTPAGLVVVANGSTIDSTAQAVLDAMADKTAFNVAGSTWITVYAADGEAHDPIYNKTGSKYYYVPSNIGNSQFKSWQYLSSGEYVSITSTKYIGDYATVYAELDYNIYSVTVVTDSGIKAVSIDGIQMLRANNGGDVTGTNTFTQLNKVEAGTHTITYTLQDGYEGTAQLYTSTGTILKDLKFTTSGTDTDDLDLVLQLYGTQKEVTPEVTPEEQSEWTITTILLLILVIIIAIMAVLVALKLNRS